MNPLDTVVAGLACREVLQRLTDYLDGELSLQDRVRVMAHLADCRRCEQFGGEVARLIEDLRGEERADTPIPEAVVDRLQSRLAGRHASGE